MVTAMLGVCKMSMKSVTSCPCVGSLKNLKVARIYLNGTMRDDVQCSRSLVICLSLSTYQIDIV